MPIDFPSTALVANVTTYTYVGRTWLWNGKGWANTASAASLPANSITGTQLADGTIENVDISSNAAIAFSKLATLAAGSVLLGNASAVPTATAVTGDVTITSAGVTAIGAGVIVNADVSASAAIAFSKLATLTAGSVLLGNASAVPTATAVTGDVTISSAGVTAIGAGVIVNADISATAAIADTKLGTISTASKVSNSATTATNLNTASAIVARDASGNFSASTISAALTGNASTATTLQTARNINGVSFNGSADITITATPSAGSVVNASVDAAAAIEGSKISPDFGAQLIATSANPGVSLTGAVSTSPLSQGVFSQGVLSFSAVNLAGVFSSSLNSYAQVVYQNSSNGTTASADVVVCNDISTDSANYGNFGINSSTFAGAGPLQAPNNVYLTATGSDLILGTTANNAIRIVQNNNSLAQVVIDAVSITLGEELILAAGTALRPPLSFRTGVLTTTPVPGDVEYNGEYLYATTATGVSAPGRGQLPVFQTNRLLAAGTAITTTAAFFFGATGGRIQLEASSLYELKAYCYFLKTTAGTVTFSWLASSAPTHMNSTLSITPAAGAATAGAMVSNHIGGRAVTTITHGASASLTTAVYHAAEISLQIQTNAATTIGVRALTSAGSLTPQIGSWTTVRRISETTGNWS